MVRNIHVTGHRPVKCSPQRLWVNSAVPRTGQTILASGSQLLEDSFPTPTQVESRAWLNSVFC